MPKLVLQPFPKMRAGEVALTLNLRPRSVRVFIEEKYDRCFRSCDEAGLPGENVRENLARLYNALAIVPPPDFASLALRTHHCGAALGQTLAAYGSLVLELDLERLGSDLIILNGDVKNIAFKIAKADDARWAHRIPWLGPARFLDDVETLFQNTRLGLRPRIHGNYIEARLPRPLIREDILRVHVDPNDQEAHEAAARLCA
jgi:hypothetical protein